MADDMDDLDVYERLLRECPGEQRPFLADDPEWSKAYKTHDWRNHVNGAVMEVWEHLPVMARLVAYIHAAEQAENEKWE